MTEEKHCNHQFVVPRRGLPNTSVRLAGKEPVTVAFWVVPLQRGRCFRRGHI